jgi:hypothetical protein
LHWRVVLFAISLGQVVLFDKISRRHTCTVSSCWCHFEQCADGRHN